MVFCKYCKERIVSKMLDIKPIFVQRLQGDDMDTDPSQITLYFRCTKCRREYTFARIVTTDELKELNKKKESGCGGCGP